MYCNCTWSMQLALSEAVPREQAGCCRQHSPVCIAWVPTILHELGSRQLPWSQLIEKCWDPCNADRAALPASSPPALLNGSEKEIASKLL